MRKILILLLVCSGVYAQDTQNIDADTAKVAITGYNRISIRSGKLFFRANTGTKKEVVSTNNNYSNPSWLSSIGLVKITGLQDSLSNKINKIAGKGLSTNDYTTTEKTKLAGISIGATANSTDSILLNRANHIGTQLSSTISDFNTAVDARVVSGITGKENTITSGTTGQYYRGDKTFQTLDKAAVGLSNVDNTSDANKPISTATQTALNGKQNTLGFTPYNATNPNGYISTYTETDPIVRAINGIVKSNGTTIAAATAGTDFLAPNGSAANLTSFPIFNQNTTGTAANVTATTNSTLTTLSNLSLPQSQVVGLNTSLSAKENTLGNPSADGYILSSTTGGTRSWIAPPTGANWGNITGVLTNQTDLNTALNLRASLSANNTFTGASNSFNTIYSTGDSRFNVTNYLEIYGTCNIRFNRNGSYQWQIGTAIPGLLSNFIVRDESSYANRLMITHTVGNVLINSTIDSGEKLQVNGTSKFIGNLTNTTGDIELLDSTKGVILKSPDGTRYQIKVANGGILTATAL